MIIMSEGMEEEADSGNLEALMLEDDDDEFWNAEETVGDASLEAE
jgi:hypothetical protein